MPNIKRKLTTILATDCVAFSKYMEEQEEKTLSSLNKCRLIIDKYIKIFNGNIFHTASDSIIAEFQTPLVPLPSSNHIILQQEDCWSIVQKRSKSF